MTNGNPDMMYLAFYDSGDTRDFTLFATKEEAIKKLIQTANKHDIPCDTYDELLEVCENQDFETQWTWYASVITVETPAVLSINTHIEEPECSGDAPFTMYLSVFISNSGEDYQVHKSQEQAGARLVEVAHQYDISCTTAADLYLLQNSPDFVEDWHAGVRLIEVPSRVRMDLSILQNSSDIGELLIFAQAALFSADLQTFKLKNPEGMKEVRKMIANLMYTLSRLYLDHADNLDQVIMQRNAKTTQPITWPPLTLEKPV